MKLFRIIGAVLSVATMVFFFGACKNPPTATQTSQGAISDGGATSDAASNWNTLFEEGKEGSAVIQLDAECQEKISVCSSNSDITETYELYTNKMKTRIDEYNVRIAQFAEYKKELFAEYVKQGNSYAETIISNAENTVYTFKENRDRWQVWSKKAIDDHQLYLEGIYSGGSIVPVLQSKYQYQVFYQRAVELANLCDYMY